MRFSQLDAITQLTRGERIRGTRTLRADEDYLRDHFPFFPVMPGVLMLEALFQASMWLVRCSSRFEDPLIMLSEVRNAKFADFVEPGQTLEIEAEIVKWEGSTVTLKASGSKAGTVACSARLLLEILPAGEQGLQNTASRDFSRLSVQREWESLSSGLAE